MLTVINCEDEKIHIPNKIIQNGYLIVFNLSGKASYISENLDTLFPTEHEFLGLDITSFIENYLKDYSTTIHTFLETLAITNEEISMIDVNEHNCYLSIYQHHDLIYFEFEEIHNTLSENNISFNTFSRFNQPAILWDNLCDVISEIIDFDRVMIYRFVEDSSGKVIAEKVKNSLPSYLNMHYPEFDIPKQARVLYLTNHFRLTPDTDAPRVDLIGNTSRPLDLSKSNIRAVSPIHLEYLKNAGVRASYSISIIIDNRLWGLVACQNIEPKFIDLKNRITTNIITQFVANKFTANTNAELVTEAEKLKFIELDIKGKLLLHDSIEHAVGDNLGALCKLVDADTIVYAKDENIRSFGSQISEETIKRIVRFFKSDFQSEEEIYFSSTFLKDFGEKLNLDSNLGGIALIHLDTLRNENMLWIRKEQLHQKVWAGSPTKILIPSEDKRMLKISPRKSFEAWKEHVKGTSFMWNDKDIYLIKRLRNLIIESALLKSEQIQKLNNELLEANNELENYAHTVSHDLKNPLSVLKLNAQVLQCKPSTDPIFIKKHLNHILESISTMEDMIKSILEVSRTKNAELYMEEINPEQLIHKVFNHSKIIYNSPGTDLILKKVHHIYTNQTLIAQVLMNLISNAVKYSSKSTTPTVIINSYMEDEYTIYEIADNGIGIEVNEADKIYRKFIRLGNASDFEGTGLGLSIVYKIMKRLKGKISFVSKPNEGTTFIVKFLNKKHQDS
ncbi:GAF domain-containing protein [Sphingobacterium olei]|uniref:histidine kinase n=1 Tax=Sphingobacterium olei TaxID=2571155 RepID=A0A4U0NL68_9SPHI|nr:ATP-binding protein [Sphingobacterium olei]TJZ54893.1 GAF domain-containing protein [Sphingobacterium olei]